jgi:hypothetical protein
MASHRTPAAHAAVSPIRPSSRGPETLPAAPSSTAAGEPSLKRAALYARVLIRYHFDYESVRI